MPELPHLSGAEAVKTFQKMGFAVARQRGSHVVLRNGASGCVIPLHKDLAQGTLRSAIKQAGVTAEAFIAAFHR